jgi:hypothetical protein
MVDSAGFANNPEVFHEWIFTVVCVAGLATNLLLNLFLLDYIKLKFNLSG